MQTIHLKQFGTVLVSRPAGLEAFNAIRPTLDQVKPIQIDFDEVVAVTPSWFDEFLTQLVSFSSRVVLEPTDNASIRVALPVLIEAHRGDPVAAVLQRLLDRENNKLR